jgi:hypothetical protein
MTTIDHSAKIHFTSKEIVAAKTTMKTRIPNRIKVLVP